MSTQPKALFLADVIDNDPRSKAHHDAAAAELRWLHEEITELRHGAGVAHQTIAGLVAQRDALLKEISALREVLLYSLDNQGRYRKKHQKIVDAAIKMAEEGK